MVQVERSGWRRSRNGRCGKSLASRGTFAQSSVSLVPETLVARKNASPPFATGFYSSMTARCFLPWMRWSMSLRVGKSVCARAGCIPVRLSIGPSVPGGISSAILPGKSARTSSPCAELRSADLGRLLRPRSVPPELMVVRSSASSLYRLKHGTSRGLVVIQRTIHADYSAIEHMRVIAECVTASRSIDVCLAVKERKD